MLDFFVPRSKRACINYLKEHYSKDLQGKKINWNQYDADQVKAIYIDYRSMNG